MAQASHGASGDLVEKLVMKTGKVTPAQLADAKELVAKMSALGVERDLLGALVDRKVLTEAQAEEMRSFVKGAAKPAMAEESDEIRFQSDTPLPKVAPAKAAPRPAGAAQAAPARVAQAMCAFHPDVPAVNRCNHCKRPICKQCVIRTEKGYFCSQECMDGARAARDAAEGFRTGQLNKAVQLGRMLSWVGAVVVLIILGLVIKYVVDDYRFSFAMQRADDAQSNKKVQIEELRRAVAFKPDNLLARVKLVKALLGAKEDGKALEEAENARKIAREDMAEFPELLRQLAQANYRKGKFREAREALLELGDTGDATSDDEETLGNICQEDLGQHEDAVDAYKRSIAIGTDSPKLRYTIGVSLMALDRKAEARKELQEAVKESKKKDARAWQVKYGWKVYLALANLSLKQGDKNAALTAAKQAQEKNLGSFEAAKLVIELMRDMNSTPDEIVEAAEKSKARLSKNIEFLLLLHGLQTEAGRGRDALMSARTIVMVDSTNADGKTLLIQDEARYGSPKKAAELLGEVDKTLARSEKFVDVWLKIIKSELDKGNMSDAERMLRDLGPLAEREQRFLTIRCRLRHMQGRDEEAKAIAEKAKRANPNHPTPYLIAASVLWEMGQRDEALADARKAVQLGAGGEGHHLVGLILLDAGFKTEGIKSFNAALKDPKLSTPDRLQVQRDLDNVSGTRQQVERYTSLDAYLFPAVNMSTRGPGSLMWQTYLASYGINRTFAVVAGTVDLEPLGDELVRLKEIGFGDEAPDNQESFNGIRTEYEKAVKSAAAAYRALLPRSAGAQIDAIWSDYGRETAGKASHFAAMGAAAEAQARMMAAWLSYHPRRDALVLKVKLALKRMQARTTAYPGELQRAIAADCATVELARAAIAAGRNHALYASASDAAMTTMAGRLAAASSLLEQLAASRCAAFQLVWILSKQIEEHGRPRTAGADRGRGRVAVAVEGGAR